MENKNYFWRPMSEYTGGRVLATNGLDVLIGEINSEGDCESEEDGNTILCGITGFVKIEEILPELKESEDERIRKGIIKSIKDLSTDWIGLHGVTKEDAIAWLEKCAPKKHNDVGQYIKLNSEPYSFMIPSDLYPRLDGYNQQLWRKEIEYAYSNGRKDERKECEQKSVEWNEGDATKLNWVINVLNRLRRGGDAQTTPHQMEKLEEWLKSLKDRVQPQQTEWSWEDRKHLEGCLQYFATIKEDSIFYDDYLWLKSLKDRVQPQPKQELSEEDEKILDFIVFHLQHAGGIMYQKEINWLNSLRPQNTWKPSDEQMEFLQKYAEQNNYDGSILTSLYNDLKKLKE